MGGYIDTLVTLAEGKGVAQGYVGKGAMGVTDGLGGPCGA